MNDIPGLEQLLANNSSFFIILTLLSLWTIPWKGFALWRAAKNNQTKWFIALLVINSLAILEITYLFYFSKKVTPADDKKEPPEEKKSLNT